MSSSPAYDDNPANDPREFRRCLGQFSTGVTVITARVGDRLVGLTANSFSSVSLEPPLVLWSIDKTSSRFPLFQAATCFAINVLADDQISLSRHFGRTADDHFHDIKWIPGKNGSPLLDKPAAIFECQKHTSHEAGDHVIIIGKVERAILFDRRVLLFSQGRYRIPADHPDDTIPTGSPADHLPSPPNMLSALFRASHRLSAAFARHREGMTRDQHRVLIGIERRPGITFEQLTQETFLGVQATDDAVAGLLVEGSIIKNAQGRFYLAASGQARRRALIERLNEMERELLKDVPDPVLQSGRKLLEILAGD